MNELTEEEYSQHLADYAEWWASYEELYLQENNDEQK